jgi:hypothetical protein
MKAKDKVLLVYPKARAERVFGLKFNWWIIRDCEESSAPVARGVTQTAAWTNAADKLPLNVSDQ